MRVAIDVSSLLASRAGIGVAVEQLVKALLKSAREEDISICLCAVSLRPSKALETLQSRFAGSFVEFRLRRMAVRFLRRMIDRTGYPSCETLFGKRDVFHANHLLVPRTRAGAAVVTVYDLTPILFPEWHIASNTFSRGELQGWLSRVDLVMVPSSCTARDLIRILDIPDRKIRVVPLGVREVFRPLSENERSFRDSEFPRGDFLLAVGTPEPRKNLERLILAYKRLRERRGIAHKLAIVGPKGWKDDRVYRLVRDLHLSDDVRFMGYVSDEELNRLYNRASLLVYSSLYEGFGFPPLEAMAAGCPVAVSRVSSMPEIVGEAGVFFEPTEEASIEEAVWRVLDSAELRRSLLAAGLKQSQRFTWGQTASATLAVYREALALRGMS